MLNCEITETNFFDNENTKDLKIYGLRFYQSDDRSISIRVADDLFCEKQRALRAMNLINTNDISEVHIDSIIEDFIIDYSD